MRVIQITQLENTDRDVRCPKKGFTSIRPLIKKDGMGFSLHKTIIPKGPPQHWHYRHHLEACYCIYGQGVLTNLKTKQRFPIGPDTIYVLDEHDDHTFQALSHEVVLISVFNPPVNGQEVHDEEGGYCD